MAGFCWGLLLAPGPQAASYSGTEVCVHLGTLVTRHLPIGFHLALPYAGYCPLVRAQWTKVGGWDCCQATQEEQTQLLSPWFSHIKVLSENEGVLRGAVCLDPQKSSVEPVTS